MSPAVFKVTVIGAAGGIGQPLSLLLAQNPLVAELAVFDVVPLMEGVGAELSQMNTKARVTAYWPEEISAPQQATMEAVKGTDLVVIPAGFPRKPGMTRADLFDKNASILKTICEAIAKGAPKAVVCVITNPVNSMVPLVAEILKQHKIYDPKRLFGVSTLDIVRANTFVAKRLGVCPTKVDVQVIGGHSGVTILPILSSIQISGQQVALVGESAQADYKLSQADVDQLVHDIQNAGTVVVEKKRGAGSATLSMAYAGHHFVDAVLRGLAGHKGVVMCTYVATSAVPGCDFFALPVELGPSGVERVLGLPAMSAFEAKYLEDKVKPTLIDDIQTAIAFISSAAN